MDELVYRGIREFNAGRFFEAHDILEDFWQGYRGTDRLFLQGLIQAAVGFYHLENRNFKGASSQFAKAGARIGAYQPEHWGLAVDHLYSSLQHHLGVLATGWREGADGVEIPARPRILYTSRNHKDNVQNEETS